MMIDAAAAINLMSSKSTNKRVQAADKKERERMKASPFSQSAQKMKLNLSDESAPVREKS